MKLQTRMFLIISSLVICTALPSYSYAATETTTISSADNLSFYFQDIELKALLQLIAKSSGLNFIISDKVKGNTTLNLKNVTWQQALEIILQSHGLSSRRTGNVIYISTIEDITSNEAKQLTSSQQILDLAPLSSKMIHLMYSNATDVANLLKGAQGSLLTARGQVSIDTHTNSIIIRDVKSNIDVVVREIHQLDVPSRQVLIEARIVSIDATFEKQLGARFGLTHKHYMTGNLLGANSLRQGIPTADVDPANRLNWNNAASSIGTGQSPGTIGIALAKIGGSLLDLELSALQGENHLEIISTPRIIASNQQQALIQTGEEIPFQEASSSGATTVTFKKAVLSLAITPQITPDNKIVLKLKATQDSRGVPVTISASANGQVTQVPSINTQEVQSNILLNNDETVVLGGIYRQTKRHDIEKIPFIGDLPIIGNLFKHRGDLNQKTELLIFITPHIIRPLQNMATNKYHQNLHQNDLKGEY